jgi:hypothetical protein
MAFVVPLRADAEEGVDVTWSAPEECPSSAELRRRVTTRVPADAAVRARGRVEKRAGRYRLALDIATASSRGERTLDASTCEALASSAAVVIAISVAPASAPDDEPAPAPASAPASASAPAPAPAALPTVTAPSPSTDRATTPPPHPADESPSRFLVRAHVVGDAGLLPSATVGGGLAFGVMFLRDLSIEANANLWASQDGTVGGTPTRGASFGLFSAGARACWALTHGIEVAPCLGVEIARLSASGFGAVKVSDASAVTWGPEALLAGRLPVYGPISIRAGIGAFLPMSRQSFVINAAGTVHRPEPVAFRTWAGPEVRF